MLSMKVYTSEGMHQPPTEAHAQEGDSRCRRFHLCQQREPEVLYGKGDCHPPSVRKGTGSQG